MFGRATIRLGLGPHSSSVQRLVVYVAIMIVVECWLINGLLLHARVYRIEKHTHTPVKYMFPNFETLNWFAAQHILDMLRGIMYDYSLWMF